MCDRVLSMPLHLVRLISQSGMEFLSFIAFKKSDPTGQNEFSKLWNDVCVLGRKFLGCFCFLKYEGIMFLFSFHLKIITMLC